MVGRNLARCPNCRAPLLIPPHKVLNWVKESNEAGISIQIPKDKLVEEGMDVKEIETCFKEGGRMASLVASDMDKELIVRYRYNGYQMAESESLS